MTPDDAVGFRFSDPRQRRIHERLQRLVGPGPAAFFRDTCILLQEEIPLEALTHAVGHYLRDIESAIRMVLGAVTSSQGSRNAAGDADQLHRQQILAITGGLGIEESDPITQVWLNIAGKGNFHGLAARAHRDALRQPRPADPEFQRFWDGMQQLLDTVLDRFEARFGAVLLFLEVLLSKSQPTRDDAKQLANQIPENPVLRRSFFSRAGENWLLPLKEEGFFRRVPPAVPVTGGGLGSPLWPESAYLARMANASPETQSTVSEICVTIAATDNFWVQEDLLDAALALPAALAAKFVPAAKKWLSGPFSPGLPEKLGRLSRSLAEGGEIAVALDLVRMLLAPIVEKGRPRPSAALDLWWYEQIVRDDVPDLVRMGGRDAFVLLCDLLEQAVRTSDGEHRDHSQLWRPSIADHPQNELPSIESALVSAVRDAAAALIAQDPTAGSDLAQELESRRYTVFRRLALYVLLAAGESAKGITESYVVDHDRFFDSALLPEYAFLLRGSFGRLSPAGQAKVFELVESGPKLDVKRYEEWLGRVPTKEDVNRYLEDWQFEKLGFVEGSLSGEWRERYDRLLAKFGQPQRPPEFRFWSTSWVGPTSPVTKDALAALPDEDLVSLLKTWQAPDQDISPSPSPDGLGRELTNLVSEQPGRLSALAPRLIGLDAVYIAAAIRGFAAALRTGSTVEWPSILPLCTWAVDQGEPVQATDGQGEWSTVREDAAYLVLEGLSQRLGDRAIPFSLRTEIWAVIERCVADPDPTPSREARPGGGPYGTAINSARGVAMQACVAYGLWVKRHLDSGATSSGLAKMPELQAVLEEHLDPNHDSSLAIRSIYGRHYRELVYLDREWAAAHAEKIFPLDTSHEALHDAAWDCYLQAPLFEPCYSILEEHYLRAADCSCVASSDATSPYSTVGHLAAHLMTLYWRGTLTFENPAGILVRFFQQAPDPLRAEAVDFVGRSLGKDPSAVPPALRTRLERFWLWRIAQAAQTEERQTHGKELAAFGRWFASPVFEDEWALERFKETLQLAQRLRSGHLELERLAALAVARPREAVECLRLMNNLDHDGMLLLGFRDEPRTILAAAIRSDDSEARNAGIALANRLIARGHLAFRELLTDTQRAD